MSNWSKNKRLAVFRNTEPSLTDQSQAKDTDINVIVKRYGVTGRVPGAHQEPIYGDFTNLPRDLRSMIEASRGMTDLREKLPQQLKEMPVAQLLALTPENIKTILQPPAPPPDKPKDEQK